jgi:hypothetical protein
MPRRLQAGAQPHVLAAEVEAEARDGGGQVGARVVVVLGEQALVARELDERKAKVGPLDK